MPATFLHLPIFLASVSPDAKSVFNAHPESFWAFLTSSVLVAGFVLLIILFFARKATTNMKLVPASALSAQNIFETVVEFLYGQVEGIVGPKLTPKCFPLLGTLFIFILCSNWFGLLPGVGTLGWGHGTGMFSIGSGEHDMLAPVLRPPTADLNMTAGLALAAIAFWFVITIQEVGLWGFLVHTFGSKGGLKGLMGLVVAVIFFCVGLLELAGMVLIRPLTLTMRLYGNIFAGETVLHSMSGMLDGLSSPWNFLSGVILPIPFYFMELLVGLLQAMVFTLLCAVYIQLSTTHDDHGHEEGAHH